MESIVVSFFTERPLEMKVAGVVILGTPTKRSTEVSVLSVEKIDVFKDLSFPMPVFTQLLNWFALAGISFSFKLSRTAIFGDHNFATSAPIHLSTSCLKSGFLTVKYWAP